MIRLIAVLARSLPLLITLVVFGIVLYFFVAWRKTPTRAKEVLIKVFLVVCSVVSVGFALVSIYAVADGNTPVLELALSCAFVGVVGLGITLICRRVFRKRHPNYAFEPTAKAKPITNKPDLLNTVTKILNYINDRRNR